MPFSDHIPVSDAAGARPPSISPVERAPFNWYALRLRAQREFQVFGDLETLGIEAFLPTWKERVKWSDREKTAVRPLFPGYVFIRPKNVDELHRALMTRGVVQILPNSFAPAAIDENEVENVRRVVASKLNAVPCDFAAGDPITIDSGPLAGVSGVVVRTRGATRVVVSVEILRRAISVELDAGTLVKAAA
jgi:transcription antitermination factor NusG